MTTTKRVLLWCMAAFYTAAGVNHFWHAPFYESIMPGYLPRAWDASLVYLSGASEIVLGLAVLVPATRRLAAWGLVTLLVAVFPANVYMATANVTPAGFDAPPGLLAWLRLPLQLPLLAWAWWYTRPDAAPRDPAPRAS